MVFECPIKPNVEVIHTIIPEFTKVDPGLSMLFLISAFVVVFGAVLVLGMKAYYWRYR